MPALKPTDVIGRIDWLGVVPIRELALESRPRDSLTLTFAGPEGEDHGGETRLSCSRVASQYKRGTVIRNTRQLSIVSAEQLAEIADRMDVEAVDPSWVGATMVVSGIPDFTHLPPSSRLQIAGGATLVVDMENRPCHLPAPIIEAALPGAGKRFKAAGKDRRGVTAWVECEGVVRIGDDVRLHIPDQRVWRGSQIPATGP